MTTLAAADRVPHGATLIGPDDPEPFEVINTEGASPVIILADHAGNAIPRSLGHLGLGDAALKRHIAFDIGVDRMTRRLSALLDAPAVLHRYSRLLIDPNRALDDPTSICQISDGIVVPGNRHLDAVAVQYRAQAFFWPYHRAVAARINRMAARGVSPAIISMHSFTHEMRHVRRPWHVGILWNTDGRIPVPLMRMLAEDGHCVGDNQPYSGRNGHGYTIEAHAEPRGLANVLIEVRQDLVATPDDADAWADRLAAALRKILADEAVFRAMPQ